MRVMAAAILAAFIGCSWALAGNLPSVVTLDGVSGARPGMSVARVQSLWGVRLKLEGHASPGCQTASFHLGPIIGAALFQYRRFRAVWFSHGVGTPSGIRIGSTLAALKRAYGSRLTRTHALYDRSVWLYYLRRSQSPHWRLRFDVSATGRITSIGFGAAGYVTAQEGCA
ncbi:MAG: hypothetical protein QOK34_1673 [Gaiellaceae bacterium]|jgi:hypothetical protein|nr:hypothetical protein [Gaiellaceae bacterium]